MPEHFYLLALSLTRGVSLTQAHALLRHFGTAAAIFENIGSVENVRVREALQNHAEAFRRAEAEMEFCERKQICCIGLGESRYPTRLQDCPDAPLVLFYRGNADLNARHAVSVVGTRRITGYGQDLCRHFCAELREIVPDALIVSGLAYGVDVEIHRQSLANGLDTLGVLAHGLDQIYPSLHRPVATEMLQHGGLLTEYVSQTAPEKVNFVRRNRIVAGVSDATIVVESTQKGGSLITASIAGSYNRDVFAFPGRTSDAASEGCNRLIRRQEAALITSAADFAEAMMWYTPPSKRKKPVQQQLFPDMSEQERAVVDILRKSEQLQLDQLAVKTGIAVHSLSALLFEMEIKGWIKPVPGGHYRLLA